MDEQRPIRERLESPTDEATLTRMWSGVVSRRASSARPRSVPVIAASAAIVVLVALTFAIRSSPRSAGPALGVPLVDATSLSDGSHVAIASGARLVPLVHDAHEVGLLLEAGRVELEIPAGTGRRWWIEAGLARVEVVGTRFVVDRGDDRVRVEVMRGAVLVHSSHLAQRVVRVAAPASLTVEAKTEPRGASAWVEVDRGDSIATTAPTGRDAPIAEAEPAVAPTRGSSRGTSKEVSGPDAAREVSATTTATSSAPAPEASDRPNPASTASAEPAAADLFAAADRARAEGAHGEAAEHLQRLVDDHPNDLRAPVAAFTLGRLRLERLGDPSAAAQAFERAIALGLPRTLEEDAHARLVESYARANDRVAAAEAARVYDERFSDGRRAKDVERWRPR